MKITDPEVIKNGEKDLITSVQEDLDLDTVRKILKERMAVATLASKGGQIVVHDNDIAFRLDFEVNMSGSLLFDRDGNFIDDQTDDAVTPEQPSTDEIDLDIDMDAALEDEDFGFPQPDDEPLEDTDTLDADLDEEEELSISLPDYGLEDETLDSETDAPQDGMPYKETASDTLSADDKLDAQDLDTGDDLNLDEDLGFDDALTLDEETDLDSAADQDADETPDQEPDQNQTLDPEDLADADAQDLDDDIDDLLKESREFWEQKKGS